MNSSKKISLKDFLESVDTFINQSNVSQLHQMIRLWAAEIQPTERLIFLSRLNANKKFVKTTNNDSHSLIRDISNLKTEIEDKTAEEPDWDWQNHNDEDSLGEFGEFIERLRDLFEQAVAVFDDGNFSTARLAFEDLLSIFKIENEYGHGIRSYDIENTDFDEVRARYLRATYLDSTSTERVSAMLKAMHYAAEADIGQNRPCLNEIIHIAVEPLPELDKFLSKWIEALRSKSDAKHHSWLREAVVLKDGIEGIEQLALAEGKQRPRAYLDWISALVENRCFEKAIEAAEFSLKHLPENLPIRAAIANQMSACAKVLNLPEKEITGRWLSFEAKPSLQKLLSLFESLNENQNAISLRKTAIVIENHLSNRYKYERPEPWERDHIESTCCVDQSLLAHAYLLSGEAQKALKLAKTHNSLGWRGNDNAQPLCVAYGLVQSCGLSPQELPPRLRDFWVSAAYKYNPLSDSNFDVEQQKKEVNLQLEQAYKQAMSAEQLSLDFRTWCFEAAEARVIAIVSNNHRRAYERAALLTAACYEALVTAKKNKDAKLFVSRIQERFPRHSAFQRELQSVFR